MPTVDFLNNFSSLDELIQLIYQGIYQFVVLSSVTNDKWVVHVGMVGDEKGRWWKGVWREEDVVAIVGPKPSDMLLEMFADKLVDSIVGGDLYLADFSTEKGARIKLTFGAASAKPNVMVLEELSPAEAAAYASNVFLEIAMQAQSRKCRLHPSEFISTTVPSIMNSTWGTSINSGAMKKESISDVVGGGVGRSSAMPKDPDVKMASAKESEMKTKNSEKTVMAKAKVGRPGKAASLANPNKKARKFEAIDFASDEE